MDSQSKGKPSDGLGQGKSRPKDATNKKPAPAPQRQKQKLAELGNKETAGKAEQKQEVAQLSDTVTKGKNGETNITVEWYWQWVGGSHPAGWKIGTLEGHKLDVTVAIMNYNKHITGTTRVDTGLAPCTSLMIGTEGSVSIVDLTSGEKRVVEFRIVGMPTPFGKLWKLIKKLFTGRG